MSTVNCYVFLHRTIPGYVKDKYLKVIKELSFNRKVIDELAEYIYINSDIYTIENMCLFPICDAIYNKKVKLNIVDDDMYIIFQSTEDDTWDELEIGDITFYIKEYLVDKIGYECIDMYLDDLCDYI